jgi:hypothetical protein
MLSLHTVKMASLRALKIESDQERAREGGRSRLTALPGLRETERAGASLDN